MKLMRTIAVLVGVLTGFNAHAGKVSLNSLLNGAAGEAAVRKAMLEYAQTHGKVVFYFGTTSCPACKNTQKAIDTLLAQFPDIIFVIVDLVQYKYLKSATWPRLRFYKNGIFLEETKSLNAVQLKALLNQYYRS